MVRTQRWLSEGWALIRPDYWTHVLLMLLIMVAGYTWVLVGPAWCGYYYILFQKMRRPGTPPQISDIFRGFDVFLPAFLTMLIKTAFAQVLTNLFMLPMMILFIIPLVGLIVGLALALPFMVLMIAASAVLQALLLFAYPLIMDRRRDFWPAIEASFNCTKREWYAFAWFVIVAGFLGSLGMLLCGFGIVLTMPLYFAATAVAYRDLFGLGPEPVAPPEKNPPPIEPCPAGPA